VFSFPDSRFPGARDSRPFSFPDSQELKRRHSREKRERVKDNCLIKGRYTLPVRTGRPCFFARTARTYGWCVRDTRLCRP